MRPGVVKRLALVLLLLGGATTGIGGAALSLHRPVAAQSGGAGRPPLTGEMRQFNLLDPPRPAPEIGFADATGRDISLAEFRGKLVLVNLWATWCGPCVEEMPSLDRLQAKLGGRDFAIVAISSDRAGAKVVEPFIDKLGLAALKVYLDPKGAVNRAFGVRGLPTTILIDREGRELGRYEGSAKWDGPDALALLKHFIDRGAGSAPDEPIIKTSG